MYVRGGTEMLTTYRFRLYPTRTQESLLNETLETCRLLYNWMLAERRENSIGFYEQKRALVELKKREKYVGAVHSQVLQDVLLRLDKTYQAFLVGLARRPRFKRKGRYNSFRYPQLGGFTVIGKALRLSKIGSVKMKLHRPVEGLTKTCTIVRDIDQWYACISAVVESKPNESRGGEPVGVDLGVVKLATLSDGRTFDNPRHLHNSITRLKTLQSVLSRKKRGSNNREKARVMLAKAWRRVRNQRLDLAHKVSANLASEYPTVVFEDLHIPLMVKNHSLASAITDASWGQLRRLTAYKVERRGGRVILVEPRGTSQK